MESEWKQCLLGDVITLKRGYDLPSRARTPGLFPIVSSAGISDSHIEAKVKSPGVITGRYGTIGSVFFVNRDFWPLNTTLYVKDFKNNYPRFIYYLLQTIDYFKYSDKAAVPGVNRNHLHTAMIHLPEIEEQIRIASLLSSLDDCIDLLRETNTTLEALAQAIFKSWFIDFDPVKTKAEGREPEGMDAETGELFPSEFEESMMGKIPKGWKIGSILDTAKLLSGGTPKTDRPEYWNGAIPWASAKDVSQSKQIFLISSDRSITQAGLKGSNTQVIPTFCTVVVARGATTGRMVVFGEDMAMNQTCYALSSTTRTPFALYCRIRFEIEHLVHAAHGSVFNTITTNTFAGSRTIIPSTLCLQAFEKIISPIFQRILANTVQSLILSSLRDTLLPKLMSGQIRLNEAETLVGRAL